MLFTTNSAHLSNTSVLTMNYAPFSRKNGHSSKTTVFTMNYALFFKNRSFYYELCTARLGAILRPFLHREGATNPGGVAERSRAELGPPETEPSRAGPGQAEPNRAELIRAGPGRAEPNRAGPGRDGPRRPRQPPVENFSPPGKTFPPFRSFFCFKEKRKKT